MINSKLDDIYINEGLVATANNGSGVLKMKLIKNE
jgi:hypothetical protein